MSAASQLDRIESLLVQILAERRGRRRRAGKRAVKVARKAGSEVVHVPTDIDRARARKILRRLGR